MIEVQAVAATAVVGEEVQQAELSLSGPRDLNLLAASALPAHSQPAEAMAEGEEAETSSVVGRNDC